MTVVSMCHISWARVVRRPTFGLAGCTRSRGRRQPNFRTRWYQVEGEAQALPSRCATTAEPPTGRRARDPEIRSDGHVPGTVDEIPKPMVVALLLVSRGRHGDDHPALA